MSGIESVLMKSCIWQTCILYCLSRCWMCVCEWWFICVYVRMCALMQCVLLCVLCVNCVLSVCLWETSLQMCKKEKETPREILSLHSWMGEHGLDDDMHIIVWMHICVIAFCTAHVLALGTPHCVGRTSSLFLRYKRILRSSFSRDKRRIVVERFDPKGLHQLPCGRNVLQFLLLIE